jgi:hypothetical protein
MTDYWCYRYHECANLLSVVVFHEREREIERDKKQNKRSPLSLLFSELRLGGHGLAIALQIGRICFHERCHLLSSSSQSSYK